MFEGMEIRHKKYGKGIITTVNDGYLFADFCGEQKQFVFPDSVGNFITCDDFDFCVYAQTQKDKAEFEKRAKQTQVLVDYQNKKREEIKRTKRALSYSVKSDFETPLLGKRAQDIEFKTKEDFFEALGYLAKPGIIDYYQAEVPDDGKSDLFEKLFPTQEYRRLVVNTGTDGQVTKQGCQFRINLVSIKNCPDSLKSHLGTSAGKWLGRINRSKFALKLVKDYGFKFGYFQDYDEIYSKIPEEYKKSFKRGYNR